MNSERSSSRKQHTSAARDAMGAEVEAVLAASRTLVGVAARSLAPVEETVSVNQFRALIIVASRGPMHSAALAEAMGLHPSNATRACDRLVALGLLDRRDNPADRRHLLLSLTDDGRKMVRSVTNRRRREIREILGRMPAADRRQLAAALAAFAGAAGETADRDLWALGWTTQTATAPATGDPPTGVNLETHPQLQS